MLGFGLTLKKLRGQHGISQRELGERIGLDFTYISKIENGSMPAPSEEKLKLMAEIFQVDELDFILQAGRVPAVFEKVILFDLEVQKYLIDRALVWKNLKESEGK